MLEDLLNIEFNSVEELENKVDIWLIKNYL